MSSNLSLRLPIILENLEAPIIDYLKALKLIPNEEISKITFDQKEVWVTLTIKNKQEDVEEVK